MTSIGLVLLILGASPYPVWQQVYDGGKVDMCHGLCLDSSGRVVVVGETNQASDYDCWMIALSKSGDSLWSTFYDDGGKEQGFAVTTTRDGALGIAALIDENIVGTILYDEDGGFLWERKNLGEEVAGILATPEQKVFTAYRHIGLERYYVTVCGYNHQGDAVYYASQRVLDGDVTDIAVDSLGYVYLGDSKSSGCSLWKFSPEGNIEWRRFYNNNATRGFALVMNDAGYLFHAGELIEIGIDFDFLLLKWNTSGRLFWDPGKNYDLGADEHCRDIALDAGPAGPSDCYLAGWQTRGEEEDVALVKTDSAGRMLWSWIYEMEGKQEIEGIEVDESGYIYLAGSHHNGENWDMLVMKVRQPLTITGRVTDSAGTPMEAVPVLLSGDTTVEVLTDTGGYYSIEVYNGGNYTVSPNLHSWVFEPPSHTYTPLAHRMWDQDFENGRYTGIEESPPPLVFDLQVAGNRILYSVSYLTHVKIGVYDVAGRLVKCIVNEKVKPGKYSEEWKGKDEVGRTLASGIYFVKMMTEDFEKTTKIVILE